MSQKTLNVADPAKKEASKSLKPGASATAGLKSQKSVNSSNVSRNNKNPQDSRKSLQKLSTNNMSTRGGSKRFKGSSNKNKNRKNEARVKDKNGNDVTPKPLTITAKNRKMGSDIDISVDNFAMRSSGSVANQSDTQSETDEGAPPDKSIAVPEAEPEVEEQKDTAVEAVNTGEPIKLTEAEKKEIITVKITETETFTLLHIPGTKVWLENEELHTAVTLRNEVYQAHLDRVKAEKDMYVQRHAQTFNTSQRNKEIQASPPSTSENGCQITTWDIYDSMQENREEEKKKTGVNISAGLLQSTAPAGDSKTNLANPAMSSVKGSFYGGGGSASSFGNAAVGGGGAFGEVDAYEEMCKLKSFGIALRTLEQAVIQNCIHDEQMLYRDHREIPLNIAAEQALGMNNKEKTDQVSDYIPIRSTELKQTPPHLLKLWSYSCALTEGQNVSCMCFNTQNQDLLAAGYGGFQFGGDRPGLILFWSLKNPHYPVKFFRTKHSVTSVDFSSEHPHLLSVGMYNGGVAIYDIRDETDKPALESQHSTGKHSEPVWGVKWVTKEAQKGGRQSLTSISTDGTVYQWSMKKGLVPHELMQLKRINNRAQFQGSHMDSISREASGLCFDFPINDGTQYFAGTEDGLIHKCSVSYEQPLENYYGHTGPVYKVRCSPFCSDVFLSCSADWTTALWMQNKQEPAITFQSGHDYITDICWSPVNSCVFSLVSRDSRLEIWNLEKSPLDPVIQHQLGAEKQLSSVLFAPDAPVVLCGGKDGSIEVFRIDGVDVATMTKEKTDKQADRLYNEIKKTNKQTDQGKTEEAAH